MSPFFFLIFFFFFLRRIPVMSSRSSWLKNFLEGEGGIFVRNFRPSSCFCSFPLCPLQSCVSGNQQVRSQVVFSLFTLSLIQKALSRVALNLQQTAKKWLQSFSSFCALGAEMQVSGFASVACSLQTAREKRPGGKREESKLPRGETMPFIFSFP